jgi:hypothetical protein
VFHHAPSPHFATSKPVDPNYSWEGAGGCDVCSGVNNKDPFGVEDGESNKPDEWEAFKKRVATLVAEDEASNSINRTTAAAAKEEEMLNVMDKTTESSGRWPP